MSARRLTLANEEVRLTLALDRGADVVSLVDQRTATEVMFQTPWAERAEQVAAGGSLLWHGSSFNAWIESYPGGWQLLCPNAGPPTERAGTMLGFHGEASLVPWTVTEASSASVRLEVALHTVPLKIERMLTLVGSVITIEDVIRNLAPVSVEFDYQHHPAFGPPLLAPGAVIETGAGSFVADRGEARWCFEPGGRAAWPPSAPGEQPLDRLPPIGRPRALLGWLDDFDEPWAAIRNPELDLGVALRWDAEVMPYAWFWQELNGTVGYPWYARAYVMAIEPSSTPADGFTRTSLSLETGGVLQTGVRLSICGGRSPIRCVDAAGVVETVDV